MIVHIKDKIMDGYCKLLIHGKSTLLNEIMPVFAIKSIAHPAFGHLEFSTVIH